MSDSGPSYHFITEDFLDAAEANDLAAAARLLDDGAHVNASDKGGATALIWAARHGNLDFVHLLLSRGAERECVDNFGLTPLLAAVAVGRGDFAGELLKLQFNAAARGQVRGETALALAAGQGDAVLVGRLVAAGADIDARNSNGVTPLIEAVREARLDVARVLLDLHADVDAPDSDGRTALIHAVTTGRPDFVSELLRKGADISLCDRRGRSALDFASQWKLPAMRAALEESFLAHTVSQLRDGVDAPIEALPPLRLKPQPR